jgi:hypothetical protein
MSEAAVFQIGAAIFVAVSTVVFLYGMSTFRDWEDIADETRANDRQRDGAAEPIAPPAA